MHYGLQTQNKSRKEISGALLLTSITRIALLVYYLLVCSAELFQLELWETAFVLRTILLCPCD